MDGLNAELAQELGKAIWAFALIERLTYKYLRKLSSEPPDALMGDLNFGARVKLIRHLVVRLEGQAEDRVSRSTSQP